DGLVGVRGGDPVDPDLLEMSGDGGGPMAVGVGLHRNDQPHRAAGTLADHTDVVSDRTEVDLGPDRSRRVDVAGHTSAAPTSRQSSSSASSAVTFVSSGTMSRERVVGAVALFDTAL